MRHQVKVAGDASSFTVVTMHSDSTTTTFDPLFVSQDLYGISGLTFAVIDDHVTPQAAMGSRGLSVSPGFDFASFLSTIWLVASKFRIIKQSP